nr:T9SS type A sorting domain-containing protein [Bacteroidota bacterium]
MKKITLITIILAFASMGWVVPQDIIFEDDFESYMVGEFPSDPWYLKYSGSGAANQIIVNDQFVSPNQSLLLECNPNWAGTADVQLSSTPTIVTCEGYVMAGHENGGPDFGFQNPDIGPWGTAYASVGVCKNGNITCNDQVLQPGEANKWYHIKIKYNSSLDLCDVWVDGVLKGKDITCSTNGEYTILRLSTHNSSNVTKGWYDDVKVYTPDNQPPLIISVLNDQVACKNDSIAFEVILEGSHPIHYQWQKDGIDKPDATESAFIIPNVKPEDGGEYRCIATNDYGSDTSNVAVLTVEFAIPTTITGFTNVIEYQVATYSVELQEGHICEFLVEGGNKIDGTENSITVHWGAAGQGYVKLLETSELGCMADTNTLYVSIGSLGIDDHEVQSLSVSPNPFTGSTKIEFELVQPEKIELSIFNHLGKLIEAINKNCNSGKNSITWQAHHYPKGIYLIHMQTGKELITKKIIKL